MFTLSDSAAEFIAGLLENAEAPDDVVARLMIVEEETQLGMDRVRDDDRAFEHGGRTVLVLDEASLEMLEDYTLDVEETEEGISLTLR